MAAERSLPVEDLQGNSSDITLPGSSLLVVVGEPFTDNHRELVLERIAKGIKTWDKDSAGCDINTILHAVASQAPEALVGENGEILVEDTVDDVQVSVLINPQLESFRVRLQGFLKSNARYRHFVYAGHVFQGSGNWVLQDDRVTFAKFASVFKESEIADALKKQEGGVLSINVFKDGDWSDVNVSKQPFSKTLKVKFNPDAKLEDTVGIEQFVSYLSGNVTVTAMKSLLKSSDVVGNIRFSRPTLYIFPGCQGDSALIGISGFNLLVNGGYNRRSCFWDFARHLDRIDAMLITHLEEDNLFGVSSVLQRKVEDNVHPEIGYMLFNGVEKQKHSPNGDLGAEHGGLHKEATLNIDLIEEGDKLMQYMAAIGQRPHPCVGKLQGQALQPINLYHKVGHGSLDMYVLNPLQESKDLKEFLSQWNKHGSSFTSKSGIPLPNMLSVCSLLVWRPSCPDDRITRILFPGSVPQSKLFEGLDRLKNVNIFQHATCSEASLKEPPPRAKKALGVKAAAAKSSPSESQRSSPRGSIKEKIPVDKIKPAGKPGSAKAPSKQSKESIKKTPTADKKPSPKPQKSEKKNENKLAAVVQKPEIASPADSTETQDSAVAISEASTADLAQMAAAVKEEMMSAEPSNEPETQGDETDVKATAEEPMPHIERSAALADLTVGENPAEIQPELVSDPAGHTSEAPDVNKPKDQEGALSAPAEGTPGTEANLQEETVDPQLALSSEACVHDMAVSESSLQGAAKELESPEPLPDPQHFSDGEAEGTEHISHMKCTGEDDEKDIDTSEELKQASPLEVVEDQTPVGADVSSVEAENVAAGWEPRDQADQSQSLDEESKSEELSQIDVEPTAVGAGVAYQDLSGYEPGQKEIEAESLSDGKEIDTQQEEHLFHADIQAQTRTDGELQETEGKPDNFCTEPELDQDAEGTEPQPMVEKISPEPGQVVVDPDDVVVGVVKETDETPFDGAEPEGLPSPREMPDVIPDESVCLPAAIADRPGESHVTEEPTVEASVEESVPFKPVAESVPVGDHNTLLVEEAESEKNDSTCFSDIHSEQTLSEAHVQSYPNFEFERDDYEGFGSHIRSGASGEGVPEQVSGAPELDNDPHKSEQLLETVKGVDPVEQAVGESTEPEPGDDQAEDLDRTGAQALEAEEQTVLAAGEEVVNEQGGAGMLSTEEDGAPAHSIFDHLTEERSKAGKNSDKEEDITESEQLTIGSQYEEASATRHTTEIEHPGDEPLDHPHEQVKDVKQGECEQLGIAPSEDFLESPSEESVKAAEQAEAPREEHPECGAESGQLLENENGEGECTASSVSPPPAVCDDSLIFGGDNASSDDDQNDTDERSLEQRASETPDFTDTSGAKDKNIQELELAKDGFEGDVKTETAQTADAVDEELAVPPQCDLYSPGSPVRDMSPQELMEPQEDESSGAVKRGQDPVQSWSVDSTQNRFVGLTADESPETEYQSDIAIAVSPDVIDKTTDGKQNLVEDTEEFDPLKEWGIPQGLPALSPGKEDEKKTNSKAEPKRAGTHTKPGSARTRPSSTTSRATTTTAKSSVEKKTPSAETAKKGADSVSRLSAAKKPAGVPAKSTGVKENGAKADAAKKAAQDKSLTKKVSPTATKKATATKKPVPVKSDKMNASVIEAKKMNTSKIEAAAPARSVGAKRPASTGAGRAPLPAKQAPVTPFYLDLAYIPHHGDPNYMNGDYFRRCRARYYVYSALQPRPDVLDLLLEAKKTWDDPGAEVTVIPTYDNEALRCWMRLNNEKLNELKIDIAPSASRCTIQLQDHETSCAAYRLEF